MSLATRHMIDKVTVWAKSETPSPTNPFGGSVTWNRSVLSCEYMTGGRTQKDQNGAEFQPMTTVYTVVEITKGSKIKIGEFTETTPPADSEEVRKSGGGTSLRGQVSEFVSWTG